MNWLESIQSDCKAIGKVEQEDIKILIREDVAFFIMRTSKRWIGAKSFGLLVGSKYQAEDHSIIYIDYALPVGRFDNNKDYPVLTDKKLSGIKERISRHKDGKEIVGWYGVRAGMGAMLTEEDQWLHQSFFNKPWQVIYLLDEKSSYVSFYCWHQKKLKRSNGYYQLGNDADNKKNNKSEFVKLLIRSSAVMATVILLFVIYTHNINPDIISFMDKDKASTEVDAYKDELETLKRYEQEIQELKNSIDYLENTLRSKDAEIKSLRESISQNQSEGVPKDTKETPEDVAIVHKIRKGDTLSNISEKYYGDPGYSTALAKINRISNHNVLWVGDYLFIPSKDEIELWK